MPIILFAGRARVFEPESSGTKAAASAVEVVPRKRRRVSKAQPVFMSGMVRCARTGSQWKCRRNASTEPPRAHCDSYAPCGRSGVMEYSGDGVVGLSLLPAHLGR